MTYRVILQRLAMQDLDGPSCGRSEGSRHGGSLARSLPGCLAAPGHESTTMPPCPRARKVDVELREILFGKTPNVYRVIFMIDGDTVRVLRIRRAQAPLTRKQIDEASELDKPQPDG